MEAEEGWKDIAMSTKLPTLPISLKETTNPLLYAKLFTLKALKEAESHLSLNGKHLEWLQSFDPRSLKSAMQNYRKCKMIAQNKLPFIRKDMLSAEKEKTRYQSRLTSHQEYLEVDGFIYEDLDEAFERENILGDSKCNQCGSTDVVNISTQLVGPTMDMLIYLFGIYLKSYITGNQLVICGSGRGYHTYAASLFSSARKIISCDADSTHVSLQKSIVKSMNMDKVEVLNNFITHDLEELASSTVVILLSPVLKLSIADSDHIMNNLKQNLRKDTILVTVSSFHHEYLRESEGWVTKDRLETVLDPSDDFKIYYTFYKVRSNPKSIIEYRN